MKEKLKKLINQWINKLKLWLKSEDGILLSLLIFFPLGLYSLWKYGKNSKTIKIIASAGISLILIVALQFSINILIAEQNLSKVENTHKTLKSEYDSLQLKHDILQKGEQEFVTYKEKMKPYENLADADAEKVIPIIDSISKLPDVEGVKIKDKDEILNTQNSYNSLSEEQKYLVKTTQKMDDLLNKINELELEEKEKAEQAKKDEEEERKKEEKHEELINSMSAEEREEFEAIKEMLENSKVVDTNRTPTEDEEEELRVYARVFIEDMERGKKVKFPFYNYEDFKVFAVGTGERDWNVKGSVDIDGAQRKYSIVIRLSDDSATMQSYDLY